MVSTFWCDMGLLFKVTLHFILFQIINHNQIIIFIGLFISVSSSIIMYLVLKMSICAWSSCVMWSGSAARVSPCAWCIEIAWALTRARVRRVCCRRQLAAAHVLLFVSSCCAAFWADFPPILSAPAPNGRWTEPQRDGGPADQGLEPKGRAESTALAPTPDDFVAWHWHWKSGNSGKSKRAAFSWKLLGMFYTV